MIGIICDTLMALWVAATWLIFIVILGFIVALTVFLIGRFIEWAWGRIVESI